MYCRKRNFLKKVAISLASVSALTIYLLGDQVISRDEVPTPVLDAFDQQYKNVVVRGYGLKLEEGNTYYEIESNDGDITRDILYLADGTVVEIEESIEKKDLPQAVIKTINKEYLGAVITKAELVTRNEYTGFEVKLTHASKSISLDMNSQGEIIERKVKSAIKSGNAPVTLKEFFFTSRNEAEDVDSPAVWHGPNGEHLLFATAKASHSVGVYDAQNGAFIRRLGGQGHLAGQFNRPNGISVVDNLMLVVERDNRRIQVFSLPDMVSLTSFGSEVLRNPYGLFVQKEDDGEYIVYVTDNYETAEEEVPPPDQLGDRVRVFELAVEGNVAEGELTEDRPSSIGATSGAGVLNIVESIYGDLAHNRLMIGDEYMDAPGGKNIKVYDFAGNFTGETIGDGVFQYQPEGIALYSCDDGSGYWIFTDQGKAANYFHLFDRQTLSFVGTFEGEVTLNTDGVWLSQKALPRFPQGVFYAIDNDGNVAAFSWAEIAGPLGLKTGCIE